jgi:hypothetical protein
MGTEMSNGDSLYFRPCLRPESDDDPYKLTRAGNGNPLDAAFSAPPEGGFLVPPSLRSDILLTALQGSALLLGPDEPAGSRKPLPWRTRMRHRADMWRNLAARRAYKAIAGYWPDNGEDDW